MATIAPPDDLLISISPPASPPLSTHPSGETAPDERNMGDLIPRSDPSPAHGQRPTAPNAEEVHIVLFVHGMWGDPVHLSALSNRLIRQFPPQERKPGEPGLSVLVAQSNRANHTYDGVDWGGERVAGEFLDHVERLEEDGKRKVVRCSIVGYSLGGLIARYVIGVLETQHFFDRVEPRNFYTFATPHIGLPRYPSFFSSVAYTLGPKWLSRTGEQFYGIDQWGTTGRPLLEIMADPAGVFYRGLSRFRRRRIYANAAGDVTVPYVTAAIEVHDPFFHYQTNGIKLEFDKKYPHIITKWELGPPPAKLPPPPVMSLAYIQSFVPKQPVLPPHLQFRYPYNYLFYAISPLLLPLLAPLLIAAILYRFSSASRESRRRIALLEQEREDGALAPGLSRPPTLIYLSRSGTATPTTVERSGGSGSATPMAFKGNGVGKGVENADGNEHVHSTAGGATSSISLLQVASKAAASARVAAQSQSQAQAPASDPESDAADGPVPPANDSAALAGEQPMLTDLQRQCAANLNGLGFEKVLVLIEGVRNAHGPLICRGALMDQGRDVLDHWAQGFEI